MVRRLLNGFIVTGLGLGSLTSLADAAPTLARRDVYTPPAMTQRKAEAKIPASRLVKPQQVAQEQELPPLQAPPDDAGLRQPPPRRNLPEETAPQELLPQETLPRESLPRETLPAEPVVPPAPAEIRGTVNQEVFRLEPPNKLIAVDPGELKPGVVYLHSSPRLGRQVWSFLQADGQFWHAFGPGTTMAIEQFDLRMTDEEAKQALKNIDPKLAFEVSTEVGIKVFLRLEADNTWKLVRTKSVSSIYDLETDLRWEKQWNRYLPVVHLCGDNWEYRDGGYQAPHWGAWMRPN